MAYISDSGGGHGVHDSCQFHTSWQGKKILAGKVRPRKTVIRKSDAMFYFVLETTRNYSIIVMLTADQKFRSCVICRRVTEEFQILTNIRQCSNEFPSKVFFCYGVL